MGSIDEDLDPEALNDQYLVNQGIALTELGHHAGRTLDSAKRDLKKLIGTPEFQAEHNRLIGLHGPAQPCPFRVAIVQPWNHTRHGPLRPYAPENNQKAIEEWNKKLKHEPVAYQAWQDQTTRRKNLIRDASQDFATRHRFDFIASSAVA